MLCKILRLIIKNRNVRLFEKIMFYASSKQNSLHFQANIKAYNDKSNKFEDNKYNKKQNEHNTITSDIKVVDCAKAHWVDLVHDVEVAHRGHNAHKVCREIGKVLLVEFHVCSDLRQQSHDPFHGKNVTSVWAR